MILPKLYRDIGIRWLIATAKVAVLFGLLLFLLSFCSCSSARKADSVSLSQSDTISMVSGRSDSVGSVSSETSWYNRLVEISGLEIIFPTPGKCSAPDTTDMVSPDLKNPTTKRPPTKIRIDALSVATSAGSSSVQAKDSVSSSTTSESATARSESSEVKVRSPSSTKWQAVLVLVFVLLIIAYTGYSLYSSNRPRDQTSDN